MGGKTSVLFTLEYGEPFLRPEELEKFLAGMPVGKFSAAGLRKYNQLEKMNDFQHTVKFKENLLESDHHTIDFIFRINTIDELKKRRECFHRMLVGRKYETKCCLTKINSTGNTKESPEQLHYQLKGHAKERVKLDRRVQLIDLRVKALETGRVVVRENLIRLWSEQKTFHFELKEEKTLAKFRKYQKRYPTYRDVKKEAERIRKYEERQASRESRKKKVRRLRQSSPKPSWASFISLQTEGEQLDRKEVDLAALRKDAEKEQIRVNNMEDFFQLPGPDAITGELRDRATIPPVHYCRAQTDEYHDRRRLADTSSAPTCAISGALMLAGLLGFAVYRRFFAKRKPVSQDSVMEEP